MIQESRFTFQWRKCGPMTRKTRYKVQLFQRLIKLGQLGDAPKQDMLLNENSRWSTFPLVFDGWLRSHDLSQAVKEITACEAD